MSEQIVENEAIIRLSFFFGIFALIAVWELLRPRRILTISKAKRWLNNISLVFLNSFILRILFPTAAVGMALFAERQNWGLLNYYQVDLWLSVFIAVVVMDLIIYFQHVLVHSVPTLWRLHRVHHADMDYDVTTGSRFHPIEIIFSMLIKFATIIVLGPPVVAVIVFEIILNGMAMFNHGNIKLPLGLDKILRLLFVTPDMHRVHHSVHDDETNSNFGFNLAIWDRLFGTYKAQPDDGHETMTIGIHSFREEKQTVWLSGLLSLPFKGKVSDYVINRRRWTNAEAPVHERDS